MAVQKQDGFLTDCRPAAEDLRDKEYHLATRNASNEFALSTSGEIVAGVIQEGKNTGLWSTVMNGGLAKVVASASWTPGQRMQAGAGGTCVPGTTNSFGTSRNSGASGEMCEVWLDAT
jgi:hypothetical protein